MVGGWVRTNIEHYSLGNGMLTTLCEQVFLLATSICIGLGKHLLRHDVNTSNRNEEYQFGMGKHISTVPEENYLPYMKVCTSVIDDAVGA